jgi:hypothetical protein
MGHAKISVTIPEEIFEEVKKVMKQRHITLSHFISHRFTQMNTDTFKHKEKNNQR